MIFYDAILEDKVKAGTEETIQLKKRLHICPVLITVGAALIPFWKAECHGLRAAEIK